MYMYIYTYIRGHLGTICFMLSSIRCMLKLAPLASVVPSLRSWSFLPASSGVFGSFFPAFSIVLRDPVWSSRLLGPSLNHLGPILWSPQALCGLPWRLPGLS